MASACTIRQEKRGSRPARPSQSSASRSRFTVFCMKTKAELPILGIAGPCTAGKSTLIQILSGRYAVELRHKAQEHSYVQDMWQRIYPPTWLIFLDVSFDTTLERNPRLNWSREEYHEQQRRLTHARAHADLIVETDGLS